jgi:hypothetical protein
MKSYTCVGRNGEPLTEYHSEAEARAGASHASGRTGVKLIPYKCQKCDYWHLSPISRQTPSRPCTYCNKDLYETEGAAESRAKILLKEEGVRLKVYKCPTQNGWHLTKKL